MTAKLKEKNCPKRVNGHKLGTYKLINAVDTFYGWFLYNIPMYE